MAPGSQETVDYILNRETTGEYIAVLERHWAYFRKVNSEIVLTEEAYEIYEEMVKTKQEANDSIIKDISEEDLKKFLEIQFTEGISLIPSLKKLANNNNPYALHELGNLEYNGIITGSPRYEEAYNYYLKSASFDHPTSNWMLSHMIINKKIGSLSDTDIKNAWHYLKKAESLSWSKESTKISVTYLLTPF